LLDLNVDSRYIIIKIEQKLYHHTYIQARIQLVSGIAVLYIFTVWRCGDQHSKYMVSSGHYLQRGKDTMTDQHSKTVLCLTEPIFYIATFAHAETC